MIGHNGDVRTALEDLCSKHRQRSLRPNFNEHAAAGIVHRLDLLGPFDRRGHLRRQFLKDAGFGIRPFKRIE